MLKVYVVEDKGGELQPGTVSANAGQAMTRMSQLTGLSGEKLERQGFKVVDLVALRPIEIEAIQGTIELRADNPEPGTQESARPDLPPITPEG